MSELGTSARIPMGEAFDVLVRECDDIVNRLCGIDEVALAYAWMGKHSWKVPAVGEPSSTSVRGNGERVHSGGGSPTTRHLVAVPDTEDAA